MLVWGDGEEIWEKGRRGMGGRAKGRGVREETGDILDQELSVN